MKFLAHDEVCAPTGETEVASPGPVRVTADLSWLSQDLGERYFRAEREDDIIFV